MAFFHIISKELNYPKIVHQFALSFFGLERYVLNAPRTNIISANKEGIISLMGRSFQTFLTRFHNLILLIYLAGYMAIHLLGLSTGTIVLPPSPSYFRRQQRAPFRRKNSGADTDTDHDSDSGNDNNHKTFPKPQSRAIPQRQNDKTAIELCSYAVVWWVLMGLTRIGGVGDGVSRRMVSTSFHLNTVIL